ncbi:monooxygenase [Bradyrhizobium sp. LTSPM299]|uniref:FAD-dependent monooxygenase n=1 Tax=Bradyrhizobium sp. LTSPM299 TaxID=1619233 RepID=UPI0005C88317|nr:FAD-dependent monooxygenase [Bradyrhizobium sp. LTSPM299]KJC62210.1 monooxygenase [Bradyrhizobium sp. LTSPM299]
MRPLHALVIGAGIGGTAAAIALRRAGLDVSLFEQTMAQREVGAGIQISPNVSRLLGRYGLGDAMARAAVRPSSVVFRRWQDGRVLGREGLGDAIENRYGSPYYHFHRADLIALLADAFGRKEIKLGRRLVDVEQDEAGVTARFEDGTSERGDLLIGADGIHSQVRERLFGVEKPRFSGQIAYRGLAPAERVAHLGLPLDVTNWVGPGGHFVHYFVSSGRFLNFVAVSEEATWTREQWSDRGSVSDAARKYEGWHKQIATIINAVDETFKWALFDRDPLPAWTQGRVALLGDACHPMLPYMAQGAAQAIEDGAALAACLKHVAFDIPSAFRAYVTLRKPRATEVQERSRANSTSFHLQDGPQQLERDHLFATRGVRGSSEAMNRLYGYDAEAVVATLEEKP